MSTARIAVTLDMSMLRRVDRMIRDGMLQSRSQAIDAALRDLMRRVTRSRLARECAKLDREFERQLADEGMSPFPE